MIWATTDEHLIYLSLWEPTRADCNLIMWQHPRKMDWIPRWALTLSNSVKSSRWCSSTLHLPLVMSHTQLARQESERGHQPTARETQVIFSGEGASHLNKTITTCTQTSWMVLRIKTETPGEFLLHWHIFLSPSLQASCHHGNGCSFTDQDGKPSTTAWSLFFFKKKMLTSILLVFSLFVSDCFLPFDKQRKTKWGFFFLSFFFFL